jgi:hypothetical protein
MNTKRILVTLPEEYYCQVRVLAEKNLDSESATIRKIVMRHFLAEPEMGGNGDRPGFGPAGLECAL